MTQSHQSALLAPSFTLPDRLRKARETAALDQLELADRLGVNRNTVSNYELGKHKPREIVLRQWSLATGVSLHWLKTGQAPPTDGASSSMAELRTFNPETPSFITAA